MAEGLKIVVTGIDTLVQKLTAYPTAAAAAITRGLKLGALVLVREVKETMYLGHAQDHLQGDTKRLRDSIHWKVDGDEAQVGTNVIYGPVHEFGATIKPKGHPFLAIPLEKALRGKSPRQVPDLHYVQSLKGQPLLVDSAGDPKYLLMRQVTIPARPYLGPAIENKGPEAAAQITNALYEVLRP